MQPSKKECVISSSIRSTMKNHFLTLFSLGIFFSVSKAQLIVDNTSFDPTYLIQNVLVGSGVTISNVTFNGSIPAASTVQIQAGTFSGVTNLGIANGIVMGTGDVQNAVGPNLSGSSTLPLGGMGGGTGLPGTDPDLNAISTATIYDQAVIEFDFVPSGDTIKFNYVFGSEEYLEFTFAGYNDAFGFFLSGPGISGPYTGGAINLAVVPGTSTPVTIDNVNDVNNPLYYFNNEIPPGATIQYDGFTVVMQAKAAVQCGQTYHIKLAICDAGDGAWDSGVFLEGGSFSSNAIDVTIATPTSSGFINGQIYEGCAIGTTATFWLVRPDASSADTIPFSYSGSATLGLDYTSSTPDTFAIFPVGQDSTSFGVSIINDGITEGVDSLVVTVFNINTCGDTIISSATLFINDPLVIVVNIPDDTINCPGQLVNLNPSVSGSPLPMSYQWSGSGLTDTTLTTSFNPTGNTTVILYAEDQCGFSGIDTANIIYIPIPITANAGTDTTLICPNTPVSLTGLVTNGFSPYTYTWTNTVSTVGTTATFTYTPPGSGTQTLVLSVSDNCGMSDTDTMTVTVPVQIPYTLSYPAADSVVCPGDVSTLTLVVVSGGTSPYNYSWSNGSTTASSSYTVSSSPITATVTVTDVCGMDSTVNINLSIIPSNPLTITTIDGDLCFTPDKIIEIPVTTTGGTGGNIYNWSSPAGTTISILPSGTASVASAVNGNYIVVVIDQCGNTDSDTASILAIPCEITIPNVVTPNGDGTNDAIYITNLEYHANSYFGLYNRWGNLMYESGAYQNDYKPTELSDGVYFYILKLTDGSIPNNYHGQIHVIKKK